MKTFLFLMFAFEAWAFSVLAPTQGDISEQDSVSVVVEAYPQDADYIKIVADSNVTHLMEVKPDKSHYCKAVGLEGGGNVITILVIKGGSVVQEESRNVYLTSKADNEHRYPPSEYKKALFHNERNEKQCSACHDMSVNEVAGEAFKDVRESNCFTCHNKIASKKHAHAPAVNWLCTSCHKTDGEIRYATHDPIADECFSCHKKSRQEWSEKRYSHEPAESGRCNRCHDPHSSTNEFYLRKNAWDLCTGCHADKIEGAHVVKTFGRKAHPTHKVKDPSRQGRELSCISCHNPHVSNAPFMLESSSVMGICSRCHKK